MAIFLYSLFLLRRSYFYCIHFHFSYLDVATFLLFTFTFFIQMWLLFFYSLSLSLFRCGYFFCIHLFRGGFFSFIHFHFSYSDVVTFLVSGNSWRNLDTSSQSTSIDLTSDASEAYYHTKKQNKKTNAISPKIHISFHDVKTSLCHRLPGTGGCCRWCKPSQEVNNFKKFNCVMSNLNHKSNILILYILGDFFNWPSLV